MELQAKKKSFWSTFKNAYLKPKNITKFWNKLDKSNLSKEFVETFNLYLNSESYSWSSKFWRHLTMNHINLIANSKNKNFESIISQEYFTFTYFNEPLVKDASEKIQKNKIDLNVNLFKKHKNFSNTQSINHNLILLLLYENIKLKKVFKYFSKLKKTEKFYSENIPSLNIDNQEITQDDLNSLFEYEKIEILLNKIKSKKGRFLEIGAGAGRTAKAILSIKDTEEIKYVIADIPPAVNICLNNLKSNFPSKKIVTAFNVNNEMDLIDSLEKNDILFIFPHQIKLFPRKTFDISLAVDCLHEMEKKIIKEYMINFENVSKLLYFKVWEYAGLPYSFYQHHSIHEPKDYAIKDTWREHFKERCLYPSNFFQLGYEFID